MLQVLIVDDDSRKAKLITSALAKIQGFDIEKVDAESTLQGAKLRLEKTRYDLLILDVALPNRIDQEVMRDGGLRLLDEIIERERYKTPAHIIAITAYPDIFEEARQSLSRRLITILSFESTSDEWIEPLSAKVSHIIAAKRDEEGTPVEYQSFLSIVCALDSPELSSVRRLPWHWKQIHVSNDDTIYYQGSIQKGTETHIIHAAASATMGMPAAAILASKMIATFTPMYLAIVGITAGLPSKTRQGDILVANPCWDGGSGKWIIKGGEPTFLPAPHQLSLKPNLRNKLRQMSADHAILSKIRANWVGEKPDHELSMIVGPMASGASVLADTQSAERIHLQHKDLIGIEMEIYGVFAAAEEARSPRPTAFGLKSVTDFASPEKDDRFQRYAAYTSAEGLKAFVEEYLID